MGAAISFYAIFSIAPLFILLIGIVRLIFDRHTTQLAIAHTLNITVGSNLSTVIQNLVSSSYHGNTGIVTAIIGGVILIVASLSVFSELDSDLDELWSIPTKNPPKERTVIQAVFNYLKSKFVNFLFILLCGFLLLLSVAFTVLISFFHYSLPGILQSEIINIVTSLLIMTVLFTLIYRILPETKLPWGELVVGAFITSILFLIGRFLISWYIEGFGETTAYGAAGSIVGMLLWVYYSAQVFFIAASGTFVYSKLHGYLSRQSS